jgi:flagellar protein FlaG
MRTTDPAPVPTGASLNDTARLPVVSPVDAVAPATPARAPEAPPEKPVMRETLEAIAASIQDYLQRNGRNLEFRVDDSTGQTVITVRDSATGEVIRQIPNAEALTIAQRLNANSGTLFDAMV